MADNNSTQSAPQPPQPDPALKRLDKLVGTWNLTGRTLDSKDDNITGHVTIQWLPGGFFLEQRGEIGFMGFHVHALEIVGYDPSTRAFSSLVYSNMSGVPGSYYWDVQGNVVTHWTEGSKYTGTFSEDGRTLTGGWRPDLGKEGPENVAYDATMTRLE